MKAMTKNAPVIKNVFERLIVLWDVASKILNYFFQVYSSFQVEF